MQGISYIWNYHKTCTFYIVSDRLKRILRVSDALNLGLTSFHCPVYNNWHDKQKIDLTPSVDSINSSLRTDLHSTNATCTDMFPPNLTKESIVNHLKYAHLFRGIGRFKCNPVHIMTKQNGVPIQKPPRKVPKVMHEQFRKNWIVWRTKVSFQNLMVGISVLNDLTHSLLLRSLMVPSEFVLTQQI